MLPGNERHFPVFLDVSQSQKEQFFWEEFIIGEMAAVFNDFTQWPVQTFNRMSRIDHCSGFRRFENGPERLECIGQGFALFPVGKSERVTDQMHQFAYWDRLFQSRPESDVDPRRRQSEDRSAPDGTIY